MEKSQKESVFSGIGRAALNGAGTAGVMTGGVKLVENDKCSVYRFRNETGEGTITMYEVFPGVALSYNDFHIRYYDSAFKPDRDIFCIDHCREGRLEYPAAEDAYS